MKYALIVYFLFSQSLSNAQVKKIKEEQYVLLKVVQKHKENGKAYKMLEANQKDINKLKGPLRGLAVYYTCWIQSDCTFDTTGNVICDLTTALGLGYQGSDEQIEELEKWFPNDKDVKSAIDNRCSVGMPGSSNFLEYSLLKFTVRHDTVTVNYEYDHYEHGHNSIIRRKDVAIIKNNKIVFIRQ